MNAAIVRALKDVDNEFTSPSDWSAKRVVPPIDREYFSRSIAQLSKAAEQNASTMAKLEAERSEYEQKATALQQELHDLKYSSAAQVRQLEAGIAMRDDALQGLQSLPCIGCLQRLASCWSSPHARVLDLPLACADSAAFPSSSQSEHEVLRQEHA